MSEVLQKELDKNYSKVQKKEIKVQTDADKLVVAYEKTSKSLTTTMKAEFKDQKAKEKEAKDKHKVALKAVKDAHKEHLSVIGSKVKDLNKDNADQLAKADSKHEKEVAKLNGLIEKINASFEKEKAKVQTQFDKDIAASNKEKDSITAKSTKDLENLSEKFADKKAKYDEKVLSLEEKRDNKIVKLNETSEKKIAKLLKDIEGQRAKVDKQLADMVPIFDEKMAEVEGLISEEKEEYDNKSGNIKSTLESKVTRRNKFLEKAENENDTKAAKQQRKEIKQLEVNADRELKILGKGHDDRNKDLVSKKLELNKNNFEQIAAIEREFVNFKEDNLMQIELNKATLADDITKVKLDTELKLKDELSKFNEFTAKHNEVVGETEKERDLDLQNQDHIQVNTTIEFNKTNEIDAAKLEEELAVKAKELKIADITKDSEYSLSNVELEAELAKLDTEKLVAEDKLVQDTFVNDKELLIGLHNIDFATQSSIKADFLSNQQAMSELQQGRAKEVLEYEELEINNRADLKVKFLEGQRARLEKDHKVLVAKIEDTFESEKAVYDKEINKIAKEDKEALLDFKNTKEEEIQVLVDEKKDLDPKADKNRIKEIELELQNKKSSLLSQVKQKEDAILVKTQLFQSGLDESSRRKDIALNEAKEMTEFENNDINYAVELVNQNKEAEIQEAKARYGKTLQNSNNYVNLATNRNAATTEETTAYLNKRVEKENSEIEAAKSNFEQNRNTLNSSLDSKLAELDGTKNGHIERIKNESLAEEAALESKVANVNSQVKQSEDKAIKLVSEEQHKLSDANTKIAAVLQTKKSEINANLRNQENKYKANVAEIDKKSDVEQKNFEAEKKRVQREYEIELKKGITNINTKLDADIKAL